MMITARHSTALPEDLTEQNVGFARYYDNINTGKLRIGVSCS